MKSKKRFNICQITVYPDRPRIRIEGDYVYHFYQWLKAFVPWNYRAYIELERYWLVDTRFFARVFERAYEYFDKIILIENNRVEEYVTGTGRELKPEPNCGERAKEYWQKLERREELMNS